MNDIFVSGITMKNIVGEAVLFDTYYEDMPAGATHHDHPNDKIPEFRDFHISHIDCQGAAAAIAITGLPQMPVNNIRFDSITIHATKGLVATQAKNIDLQTVKLYVEERPVVQADRTAEIRIH